MSGARNTFVSKVVERFISCYYLEQMATLDPTLIPAQTSFNHLFAAGVFFRDDGAGRFPVGIRCLSVDLRNYTCSSIRRISCAHLISRL